MLSKKIIIGIVVIIAIAAGFLALSSTGMATASATSQVKEFTVHGSNFKFDPAAINASLGDTVKITFSDDDGTHDICIDGYGCSQIIKSGATVLQFIADKTGTFEYYCSVGKHRELGMVGNLTVS